MLISSMSPSRAEGFSARLVTFWPREFTSKVLRVTLLLFFLLLLFLDNYENFAIIMYFWIKWIKLNQTWSNLIILDMFLTNMVLTNMVLTNMVKHGLDMVLTFWINFEFNSYSAVLDWLSILFYKVVIKIQNLKVMTYSIQFFLVSTCFIIGLPDLFL